MFYRLEAGKELLIEDQHLRVAVAQHEGDILRRGAHIHRQRHRADLHRPEVGRDQVGRILEQIGDAVFPFHAERCKAVAEAVHTRKQFGVGDGRGIEKERGGVRPLADFYGVEDEVGCVHERRIIASGLGAPRLGAYCRLPRCG